VPPRSTSSASGSIGRAAPVTPYTAKTKVIDDESGLWASMKKHEVGWFGIYPWLKDWEYV
jgi:hypothetical protein